MDLDKIWAGHCTTLSDSDRIKLCITKRMSKRSLQLNEYFCICDFDFVNLHAQYLRTFCYSSDWPSINKWRKTRLNPSVSYIQYIWYYLWLLYLTVIVWTNTASAHGFLFWFVIFRYWSDYFHNWLLSGHLDILVVKNSEFHAIFKIQGWYLGPTLFF